MIPEEYIFSEEEHRFIRENLNTNPAELALKYAKDPRKKILIAQIKSRQQIRKKLPLWYENAGILFPAGLPLEQASSEETAVLKASLLKGSHLLDMTGGLGIDTYFLSHSFATTTYAERNPELTKFAEFNFKTLGANILVKNTDGVGEVKRTTADVVYVDPHRRDDSRKKVVDLKDCEPDVTTILDDLLQGDRLALIKASPMLDISKAIKDLQHVEQVWVISLRNECKEVVFLLNRKSTEAVRIKTFNITPHAVEEFHFLFGDRCLAPSLSAPQSFLYEPNASVLKAGAQDILGESLQLGKLHPHSHFFTSDELLENFPGKKFRVKEILKPWDKSLRSGKMNVISRNFPAKANQIEKKLRLSPSDKDYLIATKLGNDELKFIVGELISP